MRVPPTSLDEGHLRELLDRERGDSFVITHGEPKPDNLLSTESGTALIDWDTALLAPAGRDLWWLSTNPTALVEYEAGRRP